MPRDKDLSDQIVGISRRYFLDVQDEYILGPEGLPHVTLCQFKVDSEDAARRVFENFKARCPDFSGITLDSFRIRPGTLVNANKFIAEYLVQQDDALKSAQAL